MIFRYCLIFVFLHFIQIAFPQQTDNFGEITPFEKETTVYEKDSTANAVILYEKGDVFFTIRDKRPYLAKKYHAKIKVLNKLGFEHSNISIPLIITKEAHEDIADIKAMTHNNSEKEYVDDEKIFPVHSQPGILEVKFTFPNVKVGSILEYKYTLLSPFTYKLDGWEFQSSIPKLYSEFNASIPYNYVYKRVLVGDLELCTNQVQTEDCYFAFGNTFIFLCENIKYAMENIPAFKSDGDFMLGASNYISRLDFELSNIKGKNKNRKSPITWSEIDQEFKSDKNIGKQLRYKGFFGRKIPRHLLVGKNEMEKAINIYNFIRDHYTWNGGFGIYGEARVKEAFNEKIGNVAEINMSLINLLNAADIESNMLLMSPRQLGLPKKTYPVMSDFNYVIAKANIDGSDYLLDATGKYHPMGILPFRALNHYGRVMDFSNSSYWHDIKPYQNNLYQVRVLAKYDDETNKFNGNVNLLSLGYDAIALNEMSDHTNEEEYVNFLNEQFIDNLEVSEYRKIQEKSGDKKVFEQLNFGLRIEPIQDRIYLNPFFLKFFKQNPFLEAERNYPVDFGYPRHFKYQINLAIPESYKIIEVPKKNVIELGENMASVKFYHLENEKSVMISFDIVINNTHFLPTDYEVLRKMFKQIIEIQNNSLIVLQKK